MAYRRGKRGRRTPHVHYIADIMLKVMDNVTLPIGTTFYYFLYFALDFEMTHLCL